MLLKPTGKRAPLSGRGVQNGTGGNDGRTWYRRVQRGLDDGAVWVAAKTSKIPRKRL